MFRRSRRPFIPTHPPRRRCPSRIARSRPARIGALLSVQPGGITGLTLKSHMSRVTAALAGRLPGRAIFKSAPLTGDATGVAISISVSSPGPTRRGAKEKKVNFSIYNFCISRMAIRGLVISVSSPIRLVHTRF